MKYSLWFYNYLKRPFLNFKILIQWILDKRRPKTMPFVGKITPKGIEWAKKTLSEIRGNIMDPKRGF